MSELHPAATNMSNHRIKGYLPLRIQLDDSFTFVYIKEHSDDTLFVTNCPVYPNVASETLLYSIFGRYGDLHRVAMTGNPRRIAEAQSSAKKTTPFDKKFAHVTYKSAKEMKSSLRIFSEIMAVTSSGQHAEEEKPMMVTVDKVELQTLQDQGGHANTTATTDDEPKEQPPLHGIHAVVARYRQSLPNRDELLAACNATMEQYEAEMAARSVKPEMDEDGFITVSHSKNATRDETMELSLSERTDRRTSHKTRSRKKRKKEPLKDFYRFQTKEYRKKEVQELRERFEQDLAKAKALNEKPF